MADTKSVIHKTGGKITRGHSTAILAATHIIDAAQKMDTVTKIVLGRIQTMKNADPLVNAREVSRGCLLLKVRGRNTLQEIYIHVKGGTDVEEVSLTLQKHLRTV